MYKRCILYILLIFCLSFMSLTVVWSLGHIHRIVPLTIPITRTSNTRMVLLPLDSRPPCTQFVEHLGRIARIDVITPPVQFLDNYKTPADKQALRSWLKQAVKDADAAIISTDMLIHGGLLASRLSRGTDEDILAVIELLKTIRRENPRIKLYAFNIIPRLLVADNSENAVYQKKLFQYSILVDQISTFENPLDIKKLNKILAEIPQPVIDEYLNLYKRNEMVVFQLIKLVDEGILDKLVIGQDDGNPFGVPNMTKQRLEHYIQNNRPTLQNKVFITRGTDELALTLLGTHVAASENLASRIYIMYSDSATDQLVMPFMPHSVGTTVREKIAMVRGNIVNSPEQADFVLYVHAGSHNTTPHKLQMAAKEIKSLIEKGYKVALVDLTEDFYASETLLPVLIEENVPVLNLAAYSGWNTTSNSIGTAITQATIFTHQIKQKTNNSIEELYYDQLTFLVTRILDDWYYLKDVQPTVNGNLRAVGVDPYNLRTDYQNTNKLIARLMNDRAQTFFRQALYNRPIKICSDISERNIIITNLQIATVLPWDRTFEIKLDAHLSIAELF